MVPENKRRNPQQMRQHDAGHTEMAEHRNRIPVGMFRKVKVPFSMVTMLF